MSKDEDAWKIVSVRAFVPTDVDDPPRATGNRYTNSQLLAQANAAVSLFADSKHARRFIPPPPDLRMNLLPYSSRIARYSQISLPTATAQSPGRVFAFRQPPPTPNRLVGISRGQVLRPLKEWGDLSPDSDEEGGVEDLEEFDGTDFLGRLRREHDEDADRAGGSSVGSKRKIPDVSFDGPEYKKTRTETVTSDIFKFFKPYRKAPLMPIHPYTAETLDALEQDAFARGAWLIPLQGTLPWEDATSGRVFKTFPRPTQDALEPGVKTVNWTQDIIKALWGDLCTIRQNGTLGPLSLSFGHSSSVSCSQDEQGQGQGQGQEKRRKTSSAFSAIKVHHSVQYSLYVRAVLDSWRPKVGDWGDAKPPRPMQGARLILLDEYDESMGIC